MRCNFELAMKLRISLIFSIILWSFALKGQDTLSNSGALWKYNDSGIDLGSSWKNNNYIDTSWLQGHAPLGFGLTNINTTVSFGPSATNKYITTYFRRWVNVSNPRDSYSKIQFNVRRDDGVIIYVNGVEVLRSNMPSGNVSYTTFSNSCATDNGSVWQTIDIATNYFNDGNNLIAVELHQCNLTSGDLFFNLQMIGSKSMAGFESISPMVQNQTFVIPPSHTFQLLVKEGRRLTAGGQVPGRADFTGYIPINGSSEDGYIHLNHENAPIGAVSHYKVKFNTNTKLWNIQSSGMIDVDASDIVKLYKNCSGAITPWGTSLSGEETRDTFDLNGDGYLDAGWLVEINPITKEVMKYNGINKQQKLWAMGRMAHENACIASDSATVYYGEDYTAGCLYKFVATVPGNLFSGTLYVLKMDSTLSSNGSPLKSTGVWIQVPNTTQAQRNFAYDLAANLGGTPFDGVEDVEIGPDSLVYFTSKIFGRIYRFKDNGNAVTNFESYVGGASYLINHHNGPNSVSWGTGNDNLAFDNEGNLWVFQDGGNHYIWVVKKGHSQATPKVQLFGCVPIGAEPTGITFSPDNRFMFMSIQHPSITNKSIMKDATGNNVVFNTSTTLVIGLKQDLGSDQTKINREITSIDFDYLINTYPNPFINSTTLELMVLNRGALSVEIYNINGQLVGNSINEYVEEGVWQIELGKELNPGFYFIRAVINGITHSIKVIKE
jgi:secreted PhoX family phosphatase